MAAHRRLRQPLKLGRQVAQELALGDCVDARRTHGLNFGPPMTQLGLDLPLDLGKLGSRDLHEKISKSELECRNAAVVGN